jgi:hypothetical protein
MQLKDLGLAGAPGALLFAGLVWAGVPRIAAVVVAGAVVAVSLVARVAVKYNAFGVQDWLRRAFRVPWPEGRPRPDLAVSLERREVVDRVRLRTINEPVIVVQNIGDATATSCRMRMRVSAHEAGLAPEIDFERTGAPFSMLQGQDRGWPVMQVVSDGVPEIGLAVQALGVDEVLARVLGRRVDIQAEIDYRSSNGIYPFASDRLAATFHVVEREDGRLVDFELVKPWTRV